VSELWQAVITSPSGQEESPHGVCKLTRDELLGQLACTARVPFSCMPTSNPASFPSQISVPRGGQCHDRGQYFYRAGEEHHRWALWASCPRWAVRAWGRQTLSRDSATTH